MEFNMDNKDILATFSISLVSGVVAGFIVSISDKTESIWIILLQVLIILAFVFIFTYIFFKKFNK